MTNEILVIAGPQSQDAELVAEVATRAPRRVTVLIEARDRTWALSDGRAAVARRDRLATLLSAVERATGASVMGLAGDPTKLTIDDYDTVVDGLGLLSAA